MAEQLNLPVMMNAPNVLKAIGGVAARYPKLRLILDHMGRSKGLVDDQLAGGVADAIALASLPNVFVKLTSSQACSSESYPYRNIHRHLKSLIDAFGPRRCFWGTDLSSMLSRSTCTYRQAVTMFTEEMSFLSEDDLTWIMGRGLAECLPWPVDPKLRRG
jgi:predicted TIM-barrel fold metal-dependent hydrolase